MKIITAKKLSKWLLFTTHIANIEHVFKKIHVCSEDKGPFLQYVDDR